jgi:hypothetical protein
VTDEQRLAAYQAALGREFASPEAAAAYFAALRRMRRDPAELMAKAREAMRQNGLDPDELDRGIEAEPEPVSEPTPEPVEPEGAAGASTPARSARSRPGSVAPKDNRKYLSERGFFSMSNEFAEELLAIMPAPILKAYVYGHRLARIDGTFYVSAGTLAEKIGARTTRHGQRVLARLQQAGLIRLIERGSARTRRANVYQLVPLESLDLASVRSALTEQNATAPVAELATA